MELDVLLLKLTTQLYENLKFSKNDVQFIITLFQNFIIELYNPFLLNQVLKNLNNAIEQEIVSEIEKTFKKHNNPLKPLDTEFKRLNYYKSLNLYKDIEVQEIMNIPTQLAREQILQNKDKAISMVHISLKDSLTNLLQVNGLFSAMIDYIKFLQCEKKIISNFIQGELWQQQVKNFKKEKGEETLVLPLFGYFDDIEMGNALGSHAGKNHIGAIYVTTPCFPPAFASKLQSIILCGLFYSRDRKTFGNSAVFQKFIEDLNDLRINGLEIVVEDKKYRIYFITSLIIGDNLGLNSIFGFTESFASNYFCRMCYARSDDVHNLTKENEKLFRTVEKYEEDCKYIDSTKTGVKEKCIFNGLVDFHVIQNINVDVMHDVLEGVSNCVITKILLKFITEDKYFSLDYINYQLRVMDFNFESSNVPPQINLEYLKKNQKLKMSASEMLFFARYLGVIIGSEVPGTNEAWKLYMKLREILDILTSPIISKSDIMDLEILISQHHELYIKLFGDLKPKFHLLTHYPRIIAKNGPVIKSSSMRFESKHTQLKSIAQTSSCNKNILVTLGKRYQLSTMHLKFYKYEKFDVKFGKEINDTSIDILFPSTNNKVSLKSITVNNYKYSINTVLICKIHDDTIEFGKIQKIFVVDSDILFQYVPYYMTGFNKNLFAYSVQEDQINKLITFSSLDHTSPCLLFVLHRTKFIVTRHKL